MATFVLVPGGWHGGWWFEPLARRLRESGHQAFAVTLTGVGDRSHLHGAQVNLDTHVHDVVRLLEQERLTNVVLCGHSYGGMVITGVADRATDRIGALVHIDAYVPDDGQSCFDLAGDTFRAVFLEGARIDGYSVAPPTRLDPRTTPHPLASILQQARLTGAWQEVRRREFVFLSRWSDTPFRELHRRLSSDPHWLTHTLPIGHDVMRDGADELTGILLGTADALAHGPGS